MLELLMGGKVKEDYPDSGPGPKNLKFGDTDAGYFGTVSQSELFTANEIISAITLSVIQRADANMVWCKFFWKGKVVYFPSQFLFNDNTWSAFASKNIVYSNAQTRTISKTFGGASRKFKIRMPAGSTVDPALLTVSASAEFFALYVKVFAKSVINAGWATGAWDSLVEPVARINQYIPTQTTYSTDTSQALWITYTGSLVNALKSTNPGQGDRGFMPVLELVPPAPNLSEFVGYYQDPNDNSRLAGWYGVVPSSEFLTATELDALVSANGVGQSTGMDDGWLKFHLDGKTLYTPKKPTRTNATAAQFDTLMNKTITVKGKQYLVRHWNVTLPTDAVSVPYASMASYYTKSDYRRLMLNLLAAGTGNHNGQEGGNWANYTLSDIGMGTNEIVMMMSASNKRMVSAIGTSYQLVVLGDGTLEGITIDVASPYAGWRPVLELLP